MAKRKAMQLKVQGKISARDAAKKLRLAALGPEQNGFVIAQVGGNTVFQINTGILRAFISPQQMERVLRGNARIVIVLDLEGIPRGPAYSEGLRTIQSRSGGQVYLLDGQVKRAIQSPKIFDDYSFDWKKIERYPQYILDAIPDGPWIAGR